MATNDRENVTSFSMACPPNLQLVAVTTARATAVFDDPLASPTTPMASVHHDSINPPNTAMWPKADPEDANRILTSATEATSIRQQAALTALAEEIERSSRLTQERRQKRRRRFLVCGALISLIVVGFISGIVVGLFLLGRRKRPTLSPSVSPGTSDPTNLTMAHAELEEHWTALIQSHSPGVLNFVDESSPQRRALQWMLGDHFSMQLLQEHDDGVLQRYALVALAFSCLDYPESWIGSGNTTSVANYECVWEGVKCHPESGVVQQVHLESSSLSGSVPVNELALLSHLTSLRLGNNLMEGTLPTVIGEWSKHMKILDLQNNDLVGTIPSEIKRMTALQSINLSGNHMEGSLPSEIGSFRELTSLDLANNRFTGNVPRQLIRLSSLDRLFLYENELTGSIPSQRCRNIRMAQVDCDELVCTCCVQGYPNGTFGAAC